MKTVVVDTNQIVERDWRLSRPWWSILLRLSASEQLRLVIPDLVVLEAVGRFRAKLGEIRRTLEALGLPFDLDTEASKYEAGLRRTLQDARAETPCHPPVTVAGLVEMAVSREPPFDSNGNGFRDAVIWAYVAEFALSAEGPVVLLTSDSAFLRGSGGKRELAPDLVRSLDVSSSVPTWFRDIGSFLNSLGLDRHPTAEEAVLRIVAAEQGQFTHNVETAVEQAPVLVYGSESLVVRHVRVQGQPLLTRTSVVEHPGYNREYVVRFEILATLEVHAEQELGTHSAIHSPVILPRVSIEVEAFFNEADDQLGDLSVELVDIDGNFLSGAIASQVRDWALRPSQVPLFEEPEVSMTQELGAYRDSELRTQIEEAAADWEQTPVRGSEST